MQLSNENQPETPKAGKNLISLIAFVLICFAVSAIGGVVTASSVGGWYQTLNKPFFNPPDWLFGPVWGMLYLFMAIAGWRIWCSKPQADRTFALGVFALQLGLNLLWSFVFFGMKQLGWALFEISVLLVMIGFTIARFLPIDRIAGLLLVPYFLWVSYATLLNAALWHLNSP